MSLQFRILGSSSRGNCTLIETPSTRVLLDAGFSARKISSLLQAAGVDSESLDAIFITHEHSDHIAGLSTFANRPGLKFFANAETAKAITPKLRREPTWMLFETGRPFRFQDLEITTFPIPHDAAEPVGYVFSWGEGTLFSPFRRLAWATDLGYVTKTVYDNVRSAQMLVLESNYDHHLLEADRKRPFSVRQRIQGRYGHLSNRDAAEFLLKAENTCWEEIWLAHLSPDCNTLEHVRRDVVKPVSRVRNLRMEIISPKLAEEKLQLQGESEALEEMLPGGVLKKKPDVATR